MEGRVRDLISSKMPVFICRDRGTTRHLSQDSQCPLRSYMQSYTVGDHLGFVVAQL
jgi:hypothetical protein